jgi:hypothetical protein
MSYTQRALGQLGERRPTRFELRVGPGRVEGIVEVGGRVQGREAVVIPVLREPAAAQVDPGETEGTLRVPTRHSHEVVIDPQGGREHTDALRDLGGNGTEDEFAEHHVVHDPAPVLVVAPGEGRAHRGGLDRVERAVVQVDTREGVGHRLQHRDLGVGEPGLRSHRRREGPPDRHDFLGGRRRAVEGSC